MMKYRCADCKAVFDKEDADEAEIDLYADYGVSGLFPGESAYTKIPVCPECGSDELEEVIVCDEEDI